MSAITTTSRGWRSIERYAFVPRSYDEVWPWLAGHLSTLGDPMPGQGRSVELHIRPAGRDISRPVRLAVGGLVCHDGIARASLHWADAAHPRLFPKLTAVLEICPVPNDVRPFTQIGVEARYRPPLGRVGMVGDHLVGADIADVTITNFLEDLVGAVTDGLPPAPESGSAAGPHAESDNPNLRRHFLTVDGFAVRGGGAAGVYEALSSLPGVAHVSVDPLYGLVAVDHDPDRCGLAEMVAVLERSAEAARRRAPA
jgi:copper chaperone CopZ